jgi:hypothetical protein
MTPSPEPTLRASDVERERYAEVLREHAAQGRLTVDELDERLDRVYAARTHGELAPVVADLPAPTPTNPQPPSTLLKGAAPFRRVPSSFVLVNLMLIAIWAATGAGYFWPMWPLLGWGLGLLGPCSRGATRRYPTARS